MERRGREKEGRGGTWRGRIVPRAMVPSAGTTKGWRGYQLPLPTSHPICFCFPCTTHPPALKEERELGEERKEEEKEEEEGRAGERWFVNIHYVCVEKGEAEGKNEKWKRNETVGIHAWRARVTRGMQEFTATRARVKRTGEKGNQKNVPPNQCSRLN